nr:hypothetical protein TetV2_00141 [Oceanusvirus sp.]
MSSLNSTQLLALLSFLPKGGSKVKTAKCKGDVLEALGVDGKLDAATFKALCVKAGLDMESSVPKLVSKLEAKLAEDSAKSQAVQAAKTRIDENSKAAFAKKAGAGEIKPKKKPTDAAEQKKSTKKIDADVSKPDKVTVKKEHHFAAAKLLKIDCTDLKTASGVLAEINKKLGTDHKTLNKTLLGAVLHHAKVNVAGDADVSTMLKAL